MFGCASTTLHEEQKTIVASAAIRLWSSSSGSSLGYWTVTVRGGRPSSRSSTSVSFGSNDARARPRSDPGAAGVGFALRRALQIVGAGGIGRFRKQ